MIIIDNSLCNMDISEKATRQNVQDYIVSLFESGVDLVELDYNTIGFLEGINTSNRFTFRVERSADLVTLMKKQFYFVVIPLSLSWLTKNLTNVRFIIEIDARERDYDELIELCRDLSSISSNSGNNLSVRIIKDFDCDDDRFVNFIDRFYKLCTIPLDICPLNTRLTGLDAVYTAFLKGVNIATMGFSASHFYTPYELFVLYFPNNLRIRPQALLMPYLLVCAARYNLVTDEFNRGLFNIIYVLDTMNYPTINVDGQPIPDWVFRKGARKENDPFDIFSKAQNSFFREFNLDSDYLVCKDLAEFIDRSDLILYNRFFSLTDFDE